MKEEKSKDEIIKELRERIVELEKLEAKHKKVEEALKESEEKYRTTLDSMGDAIHVVDSDLRFVLFNAAFKQWNEELRLDANVIGRTVFEVFPFLSEKIHNEYQKIFNTGKTLITEESTKIEDRKFITETRKIPIFEEGRVARVVTVVRDITEHKLLEQQKEKSRKEAEFYADVLGHDVGNINQIISGHLYLLENAKDEETRKKNVGGIKKSIMKSKRLAESIKTLKIIKDTKIEKFDLNKSIERSIKNIKEYSDREIEVNLDVDKKYYVNANDFLDKVFFNILENAVEYTFHDPVIIDVKTEEKDCFCSVHICDYGLGISKEKREDILENLETLSKRTGIGFYLTKKILDRLNGKFEIKDVKKGTEIVVSIPVRP